MSGEDDYSFDFDSSVPKPRRLAGGRSIQERFDDFHRDNPHVYELFRQYAFEVIQAGRTRYSADAIFHRIRWHMNIETRSDEDFKLNDHFTALYARLFRQDHPEHAGLFETRRSQVDKE